MINTQYPSWMLPQEGPMANLFKGVAAGSQIANNRAHNQQLYAQIQQFQQQQDLREREFIAENESRTLQNEVARIKLQHDTEDYETARRFYPILASAPADTISQIERPNFHATQRQEIMEQTIAAKTASGLKTKQMEGTSKLIGLTAEHPDPTDPALAKKAADIFLKYNLTPEQWNHWENHQEHALKIKQAGEAAEAKMADRSRTLDISHMRAETAHQEANTRAISVADRRTIAEINNETRRMRLDPTTPYNESRIALMDAQREAISARANSAALLNPKDKAQVTALSKSLSAAYQELGEARNEKAKARARDLITEIERKLNQFSSAAAPAAAPAATASPMGPPAPPSTPALKFNPDTGQWE